jgi:hypothetical protein
VEGVVDRLDEGEGDNRLAQQAVEAARLAEACDLGVGGEGQDRRVAVGAVAEADLRQRAGSVRQRSSPPVASPDR